MNNKRTISGVVVVTIQIIITVATVLTTIVTGIEAGIKLINMVKEFRRKREIGFHN